MGVFVSYSRRDKDAVTRLSQDLQDADEQVWLDQRLGGGDAWWRAILEQIRGCEVFLFALSQNSIQSKPCQAELRYAQDLGLPILPVQVGSVDSMQLNPLATVQTVDYRSSTSTVGMRLLSALNRARAQRQPLPAPLPAEPPVPFEYLIRLYTTISGTDQLSPRDQAALVTQLEFGLREDGDHDAARKDIVVLLNKLRDREDVTYRTRTEVDAILAEVDAEAHVEPVSEPPGLAATIKHPLTRRSTDATISDGASELKRSTSPPRDSSGETLQSIGAQEIQITPTERLLRQPPGPQPGADPLPSRPRTITATALTAFASAALSAVFALIYAITATNSSVPEPYEVAALVHLASAVLLTWGGIAVLKRVIRRFLPLTTWVMAALDALLAVSLQVLLRSSQEARGTAAAAIFFLGSAITLRLLLRRQSSREFLAARGNTLQHKLNRRSEVTLVAVCLVIIAVFAAVIINGESRSARESRLFAKLPFRYNRSDCESYPAGGAELAELRCTDHTATPPVDAFYGLYASHSALDNEFTGFVDQRGSSIWGDQLQPCPGREQSPTSWKHAESGGSVACLSNSSYGGVIWTVETNLVMGWTFSATSIQWWQNHFG